MVGTAELAFSALVVGKLVKRYVKRGRQYHASETPAEDADTGKLLFKGTRESLVQYKKVAE